MTESKNYTVDIAMHSEEIKVYDLINICETRFRNGISAKEVCRFILKDNFSLTTFDML